MTLQERRKDTETETDTQEDTMWQWRHRLKGCNYETRNTKDRWPPPEARKSQGGILLYWFQSQNGPVDTLILDLCLQNCETINLYWFKPFSLWHLVTAALGNGYSILGQCPWHSEDWPKPLVHPWEVCDLDLDVGHGTRTWHLGQTPLIWRSQRAKVSFGKPTATNRAK